MRQGKEMGGGGILPATGKSLMCLETKPVLATLIAFSLIMLTYNLQPYYHSLGLLSLSSTSTCHCSLSLSSPNISTLTLNTSSSPTPLLSLSSRKLSFPKPIIPSPIRPKTDPNKRTFTAIGNAAALFVKMGAYRGGPNTFSIIGLASKPTHVYGTPWYKCEYIPNSNGTTTPPTALRTKGYKILPDWGYGRVYTVVVVNCTFPTNPNRLNLGGKLMLNAYYSLSPRKFERLLALEEAPNSYNEDTYKPPFKYDYLYCGSSLYGNLSASRIREWVAYHTWFFGERSHFVFHDAGGVSEEVMAVLEPWVRIGRVTVQDIREQENFDGYYYNQFLVVNDCLHRYRFAAKWTFFYDVDEYIYLPDGKDKLDEVMKGFDGVTQFTIEQNPMSSMLCLNESGHEDDYTRQWGFEKLVFRDSRTRIRRDRKYAIQARNAYASGVHMSENVVGKTLHHTESKIRYYHYHNSIQVKGEPCRVFLPPSSKRRVNLYEKLPYVYDDNMKKLADTVKQFERQTLGTSQLPL